jgi:hypothetical protein
VILVHLDHLLPGKDSVSGGEHPTFRVKAKLPGKGWFTGKAIFKVKPNFRVKAGLPAKVSLPGRIPGWVASS